MEPKKTARDQISTQKPCPPHPPYKSGSGSKSPNGTSPPPSSSTSAVNIANGILDNSADDASTTYNDKLARVKALHARWKYEDNEEEALEGNSLQMRQCSRCKELGSIIFGYILHKAQIDTIHTLYYERRDLLLLAKTGFGKNLIFQLILFLTAAPGLVLTLIPLK